MTALAYCSGGWMLAYQGASTSHEFINHANRFARRPDLTLFLYVPANVALDRVRSRGAKLERYETAQQLSLIEREYSRLVGTLAVSPRTVSRSGGRPARDRFPGPTERACGPPKTWCSTRFTSRATKKATIRSNRYANKRIISSAYCLLLSAFCFLPTAYCFLRSRGFVSIDQVRRIAGSGRATVPRLGALRRSCGTPRG